MLVVANQPGLPEIPTAEGAQAGLSWETILKKRQNYREAFDNFDPAVVSRYGQRKRQNVIHVEIEEDGDVRVWHSRAPTQVRLAQEGEQVVAVGLWGANQIPASQALNKYRRTSMSLQSALHPF